MFLLCPEVCRALSSEGHGRFSEQLTNKIPNTEKISKTK